MKFLKSWKDDGLLKILAFSLAVMMWFFVTYKGQSEMVIEVPIEFKNIPKGFVLIKQSVNKVNVQISGHERLLKALRPINARLIVDSSSAKRGENEFHFNKNDVIIPRSLKVTRIEPTSIKYNLDESQTKTVPVRVPVIGIPDKGYKVTNISVNPSTVQIEGARSEINEINLLKTETIDVTGLDKDFQQNVKINTGGKNIMINNSEVLVRITISGVQR